MIMIILNILKGFKDLIKILINYSCILLCSCIKNKCIDNENDNNNDDNLWLSRDEGLPSSSEINENIKSPTPLLKKSKHPILDAYENKIIEKINNNT